MLDKKIENSVLLMNPKYIHNLGASIRACACFGFNQLWWTGNRINLDIPRLPREFRMKDYKSVDVIHTDKILSEFYKTDIVPIAVEIRDNSEDITFFQHPENAIYVFGSEDNSINRSTLKHCHRFVHIPTKYCINLSSAVYIILYDRICKEIKKENHYE